LNNSDLCFQNKNKQNNRFYIKNSDEGEELFRIAHFMMRNSAWDPYKQSLLAICLIESTGNEAIDMWHKVLTPLEKAYENTSGEEFKNQFGFEFLSYKISEEVSNANNINDNDSMNNDFVGITRKYAIEILTLMSTIAKEAGQLQDTPENEKKKGVITPFQKAERDAKRKVTYY